jgi:hypothetical protein
VAGEILGHLEGIFEIHALFRVDLAANSDLMEYLALKGRSIPGDSRMNQYSSIQKAPAQKVVPAHLKVVSSEVVANRMASWAKLPGL